MDYEAQHHPLAITPIPTLLAKFAIPSIISMLVNALYNIVDQIFIGQGVGYLGNAATNIVFPITILNLAFALLIGDGAAAYFSLKLGERDVTAARTGFGNAVVLLAGVGVLFLTLESIFLEPLLLLFGATEQILPYAIDYGRIIVLGAPFMVLSTGLSSLIRADGNPRGSMIAMLAGAVINTVFDPILIFQFNMGVTGAAIATVAGQIVSVLICLLFLPRLKNITLARDAFQLNLSADKRIASLGISSFITQIASCVVISVINNALKNYGALSIYGSDIPLAAFGIVAKVNNIMFSIVLGLCLGAQPIEGYNYGAGNFVRVRKTFLLTAITAFVVAAAGWVGFEFFPQYIVPLFGSESDLYNEFAIKCFRIFLAVIPLSCLHCVISIFFQSIGKPVEATLLSLSRQILFLIPLVYILCQFWGIDGILLAGPASDILAFLLALILGVRAFIGLGRREKNQIPT